MLYSVLYVHVNCFVVRECAVSVWRRYINVCNSDHDVFSVVNVYLDHLKCCVVCINGPRYVCCYVVSEECESPPLSCAIYWCARW